MVISSILTQTNPEEQDICKNCGGRKTKNPTVKKPATKCCGNDCSGELERNSAEGTCSRLASLSLMKECNCDAIPEDEHTEVNLKHNRSVAH